MFSTKRLTAIACALALVSSAAQAQQGKQVSAHTQPVSARVPAADIDIGSPAPASGAKAPPPVAQPAVQQPMAAPSTPHLSIDDIDQITRSKIARQLAGDGGQQGVVLNAPAPASAPAPAPVIRATPPSSQSEPVRFVGAFSDMSGTSVLYEYRNASYPAHVGTKLLNGWTVKRVDGFVVTVADSKHTWTETISGGTAPSSDTPRFGVPIRPLNELGAPLPPAFPLSAMGQ